MSRRCKLQKEFYKDFGDYKGKGKYNDTYVRWLENKLINFRNQENDMFCDHKQVDFINFLNNRGLLTLSPEIYDYEKAIWEYDEIKFKPKNKLPTKPKK